MRSKKKINIYTVINLWELRLQCLTFKNNEINCIFFLKTVYKRLKLMEWQKITVQTLKVIRKSVNIQLVLKRKTCLLLHLPNMWNTIPYTLSYFSYGLLKTACSCIFYRIILIVNNNNINDTHKLIFIWTSPKNIRIHTVKSVFWAYLNISASH